MKTLSEFPAMTDCFFREDFAVDEDGKKHLEKPESREYLAVLADRLAGIDRFHARRDRSASSASSPRSAASRPARSSIPPAWPSAARPRAPASSR